jgi:hypothetical protein
MATSEPRGLGPLATPASSWLSGLSENASRTPWFRFVVIGAACQVATAHRSRPMMLVPALDVDQNRRWRARRRVQELEAHRIAGRQNRAIRAERDGSRPAA